MTRKQLLLPCISAFLVLLLIVGLWRTHAVGAMAFRSDAVYMDIVIARTLGGHGILGVDPTQPAPATRDTLWRVALALAGWFFSDFTYAALALGAMFGIWALVLLFRLGHCLVEDSGMFSGYAGLVLILSPMLFLGALSGTSVTLAMTLVLGASLLHLRSMREHGSPLSAAAAFLVGLACWLRLEFALLWIIFWGHALVCALLTGNRGRQSICALVRGLNGVLIMALCLAPLAGWNLRVLGVPWPRVIEAPLALDVAATSGLGMTSLYFRAVMDAMSDSYARLQDIPFLRGSIERCALLAGVIFVLVANARLTAARSYGLFIVFLLAPLFYALFYPFTGWSGADLVFRSLSPIWILLAAFGVWRCAEAVIRILRKFRVSLPGAMAEVGVFIVFCFLLAAVSLAKTVKAARENLNAQVEASAARAYTEQSLADQAASVPLLVATDRPGWLLYRGIHAVDITGETNPDILARLNAEGRPDAQEISALLRKWKATHFILWDPKYAYIRDALPCVPVRDVAALAPRAWPEVCRLNWPGAP